MTSLSWTSIASLKRNQGMKSPPLSSTGLVTDQSASDLQADIEQLSITMT